MGKKRNITELLRLIRTTGEDIKAIENRISYLESHHTGEIEIYTLKKRLELFKSKGQFYLKELKGYGQGNTITVLIKVIFGPEEKYSWEYYQRSYTNITEQEARELVKLDHTPWPTKEILKIHILEISETITYLKKIDYNQL